MIFLGCGSAGCASDGPLSEPVSASSDRLIDPPTPGSKEKSPAASKGNYIIGPEDILEVSVWENRDLSVVSIVRPDGMISMPLLGDIPANERTPYQLQTEIEERLKEYKQDPQVSVMVREPNSYVFYVMGEVMHPGKYPLKSNTTLLQALAVAGGFTQWADRSELVILRKNSGKKGKGERVTIRYKDIIKGKNQKANVVIHPGDTVVVP
jgi:polysaccharide export outer membrane protein